MSFVWLRREDCETGNLPDLCLRCGCPTTHRVEKDSVPVAASSAAAASRFATQRVANDGGSKLCSTDRDEKTIGTRGRR